MLFTIFILLEDTACHILDSWPESKTRKQKAAFVQGGGLVLVFLAFVFFLAAW